MTLCQDCQKITLTNLNHGTHPRPYRRSLLCLSSYAVLKPSARALSDSADNGCPLCAKFWDNLSRQGTQTTELLTALTDGRWPGEEEGEQNPRVIISWHYMKDETDWLFNGNTYISCGKWGMYCNPSSPLPDSFKELFHQENDAKSKSRGKIKALHRGDDHTGSDINLELAKFWLQDCQSSHEDCTESQLRKAHEQLPSRVIDVNDQKKPYVLDVGTHLQRDDYLTLSYCWGHGKRLLNTKEDAAQFRNCLPMDNRMPRTFSEAFQVTRVLGYRYIWIDALCILQDDPFDLAKEMTKMGEIYQNSVITIFAGNGPSVQAGLFAPRDGPSLKPSRVCVQTVDRPSSVAHQQAVSFVSTTYSPEENPLSTRAWILQEQVLAQRQLVFTPREIMWTCKTKRLSERCPHQYVSTESKGSKINLKVPDLAPIRSLVATLSATTSTAETPSRSKQHFSVWYRTVETYNARNLSVASDKLPAISAIARLIHTRYGCEYGAGLFKGDLAVGLCWTTDRAEADPILPSYALDNKPYNLQQEYIAPSWSWASLLDTPLLWKGEHRGHEASEEGIEVLGWQFSYAPHAMIPFGRTTSGVLTVRSHIRKCVLVPHFGEEKWPRNQRRIWGAWAVDRSTGLIVDLVALDSHVIYCELKKRFEGLDCGMEEFKASPREFLDRALRVACLVTHVENHSSHRNVLSLVLVPDGLESDEWRRIGLLMEGAVTDERWGLVTSGSRRMVGIV